MERRVGGLGTCDGLALPAEAFTPAVELRVTPRERRPEEPTSAVGNLTFSVQAGGIGVDGTPAESLRQDRTTHIAGPTAHSGGGRLRLQRVRIRFMRRRATALRRRSFRSDNIDSQDRLCYQQTGRYSPIYTSATHPWRRVEQSSTPYDTVPGIAPSATPRANPCPSSRRRPCNQRRWLRAFKLSTNTVQSRSGLAGCSIAS